MRYFIHVGLFFSQMKEMWLPRGPFSEALLYKPCNSYTVTSEGWGQVGTLEQDPETGVSVPALPCVSGGRPSEL